MNSPRSVRLESETETHLAKLIEAGWSWPQILNFATENLINELESGKEIRLTKDGIRLVHSNPNPLPVEKAESSGRNVQGVLGEEEAARSKKTAAKRARA